MANADKPLGFTPVAHRWGAQIRANKYIATTSTTIFIGDPVIAVAAGTVTVAAANWDAIGVGISSDYIATATAGDTIQIYDDPGLVFMVQCTTGQTPAAADIFATANMITYAAGSTTTGLSIMELDALGQSTGDLMLMGLLESPDNAWGEHAKVLVIYNQHLYRTVHAGL
jgi:hypothetical protein